MTPRVAAFAIVLTLAAGAHAQSGNVRSAAEEFDAGRRAYRAGDFAEAARSFEAAYLDAPNPEALRSALVARQKAKQLARAATLAAYGERAHPADAPLAAASKEVLGTAKTTLGSFVANCTPKCSVVVDGQLGSVVDDTRVVVFLEPGTHQVNLEWPDKGVRSFDVQAAPGSERTETAEKPVVVAPPPPAQPVVAPAPTKPVVLAPPPPKPEGWHPPLPKALFFVAAGLTVAAGAGTVISGVYAINVPGKDTVRRECVGQGPDCPAYVKGEHAELRTNVLLGTTIGLAAVTTAFAFFTDWRGAGSRRAATRVTPAPLVDPMTRTGGVSLAGRF